MSTDTHAVGVPLEGEVRELIRQGGPRARPAQPSTSSCATSSRTTTRHALGAVVPLADPPLPVVRSSSAVAGLGPLQPYLDDPDIEEDVG